MKKSLGIAAHIVSALVVGVSACAVAQSIATKDLTHVSNRAPGQMAQPLTPPNTAPDESDCFVQHSDGAIVRDVPEKLSFEIISAEPRLLHKGGDVTVTVRLKNEGDQQVMVPWQSEAIEPVKLDPSDETLSYEKATLRLAVGDPEDDGKVTYLKGEASLFAAPNNRSHVVELSRGQWVEVTFRAVVECALKGKWACPGFRAHGNQVQLTAHWSEYPFTSKGTGCKVVTGAYESRAIASKPLSVTFGSFSPLER